MITILRSTWQDIRELPGRLVKDRAVLSVIILTLAPWFILIVRKPDLNDLQPLGGFLGFVALYWLVCHRQPYIPVIIKKPSLEFSIAFGLVVLWILYRVGEYWHWFTLPDFGINACSGNGEIAVLKMAEMVVLPFLFLLMLKYTLPELGLSWNKSAWLIALVPILALLAWGVSQHPLESFATSSACYFFDAGLPEEFLFRTFLQTRLEAIIHRPVWALWVSSFIFGLAHVPIDLHGSFAHWPDAFLTALTFQMSAGLALGYAYMRTRNLLPLSVVHMFIDSAF
jgi:membrane protease YdiL (CAAX protease family)